jgi:hypothetical protein
MKNKATKTASIILGTMFFLINIVGLSYSDFKAHAFLKDVRTAAGCIADGMEQAQRTTFDHDTVTVYLYHDDFGIVKKYLPFKATLPGETQARGKRIVLEAITLRSIKQDTVSKKLAIKVSMEFTDGTGNMLPQNLLVNFRNFPSDLYRPVFVRFMQGDLQKPFANAGLAPPIPALPNDNSPRVDSIKNAHGPESGDKNANVLNATNASTNAQAINSLVLPVPGDSPLPSAAQPATPAQFTNVNSQTNLFAANALQPVIPQNANTDPHVANNFSQLYGSNSSCAAQSLTQLNSNPLPTSSGWTNQNAQFTMHPFSLPHH